MSVSLSLVFFLGAYGKSLLVAKAWVPGFDYLGRFAVGAGKDAYKNLDEVENPIE